MLLPILILLGAPTTQVGAAEEPAPPLTVAARVEGGDTHLHWVPPLPAPDSFTIYGLSDGEPVLLHTVAGDVTTLTTLHSYEHYGVASVDLGVESGIIWAQECTVQTDLNQVPPFVAVRNCPKLPQPRMR